jgi:acyl-homoserine-lactone acylase
MRRGSAGTLALAFAAMLAAAPAQAASPITTLRGERGLDAVVRTTSYGIPHILARSFQGLGYGYGYALARANVCTLADTYATVRAERSRFFGPDSSYRFEGNGAIVNNLNSDFFFQRIIDARTVEELLAKPPPNGPRPEVRRAVRGYVRGYNRWLRRTGVDRIPDPTCRGKPWVRPIEEIDAYRRFYQLALLASAGVAIDGIAAAEPLAPGPGQASSLGELPPDLLDPPGLGSNAYGLGGQSTRSGRGMVLGNPHFPWQGAERFFQAHLTVPGKADVAGASLMGVPVVLIGHTRGLAWSHTVSTARRFTIFELQLVPGSPTTYVYEGQPRQMRADRVTVRLGDGQERTRTLYSSHHGPVFTSLLGLSAFPWTPAKAFALGDANAPNFRYLNHFFETNRAQTVRQLDRVLRRNQGIPWVNTIAADSRGEAYYADISVVPHLTDEQAQRCNTAAGQGTFSSSLRVAILDGSRSDCEWGRDDDAIQPGTFGPGRLPHLFRRDYVTNSNDSYWLSNPKQPLEGFDRIIGDEGTERSLRTRLGLLMVDGRRFSLRELMRTVQDNRVYSGELFRDDLVRMCDEGPPDVREACPVLRAWNLKDDLDSPGAVLFRRFATRALQSVGGVVSPPGVFRVPFDRNDPVNTPRGLNTESPAVRQALSDAVDDLRSNGIPLDARLREYQSETRGSERIPIHGGPHTTGVFNVITAPFAGRDGFPDVIHGSSFVMVAEMRRRCPESRSILTYSQAATDTSSPHLADQTRLYSNKRWVDMRFCPGEILRDRQLRVLQLGCVDVPGFTSVRVAGRSGRLRFRWRRRLRMPVRITVLRNGRRVARFRRARSFSSRRRLPAGRYLARFAIRSPTGKLDRREVAFRVRAGRVVGGKRARRLGRCRRR